MNVQKFRYVHEGDTKVYKCTFQLHLLQLRILLKFPCKFFIEWKTANGKKSVRTEGLVDCINGKVIFNQNLLIETQMLYSIQNSQWIRKISTISVFLITKNKPDFSQLAGRLNIDLSVAMQANPYHQVLTQSLTHASAVADLKFSLDMKSSLHSQKLIHQVDLLEFSDRLMYVGKRNDLLNKSKSMGCLKSGHSTVSPVYQLNSVSSQINVGIDENKPLIIPKTKLQNFGHNVYESIELQSKQKDSLNDEFNIRMTLGKQRKNLSRQDYELMINQQTKGMKKSDLMAVPDMKKSGIEQDDSQLNSKKTQQDEVHLNQQYFGVQKILKKSGSENKQETFQPNFRQSDVDIMMDMSDGLLQSRETYKKESARKVMMISRMGSMNSSNSFSISQFKAQFQSYGHQSNGKTNKGQKQSTFSLEARQKESLPISTQENDDIDLNTKYEDSLRKMSELQSEVNGLTKILAEIIQKHKILQEQLINNKNLTDKLQEENKQLLVTVRQLQRKGQYESKINQINIEKLKKVSSQLTIEKSRIRFSESSSSQSQVEKLRKEVDKLREKLKTKDQENQSLKKKLQQRDQVELQNQIKIQQLQEHLERQRANKTLLNQSFKLRQQSNIQNSKSKRLQEHIKILQTRNAELQKLGFEKDRVSREKIQKIQNGMSVIQREFQRVVTQLLRTQKLLSQKSLQVQQWKTKSYSTVFASSTQQQHKTRHLQQELLKKQVVINSFKRKINELQVQIQKLSVQNLQLNECYNKLMRESYRFEGELKVIKEEDSFRDSVRSSGGETFRMSGSHGFTAREESACTFFKETLEKYIQKRPQSGKLQNQLIPQMYDTRKKAVFELQKASFAIIDLLNYISSLEQQIQILKEIQVKTQSQHQIKVSQLQTKIDQIEQNEKISAGSSNIVPSRCPIKSSIQNFDKFSDVTKKRSILLTSNAQTKLTREIQKLKSIIYDKNKEISDLIASYEKLKLQKQTQSMLIKSKRLMSIQKQHLSNEDDQFYQSDVELVHDILDLQIRLNKEKQKKNRITQELELRKSLNRSQQLSQNIPHFDLSTVYNEIRAIITGRENYITTQEALKKLVIKINELNERNQNQSKDKSYKLAYFVQEKSRILSKQLQVMKSALLKLNFKGLESMQCKTFVANAFKPAQHVMSDLLLAIQQMISSNDD